MKMYGLRVKWPWILFCEVSLRMNDIRNLYKFLMTSNSPAKDYTRVHRMVRLAPGKPKLAIILTRLKQQYWIWYIPLIIHMVCFVLLCCVLVLVYFTNIVEGHFTGIEATLALWSQCQKSNHEEYGLLRGHFAFAPSQWGTMLQCNVVSHWPGACTVPWLLNRTDDIIKIKQHKTQ